MKNSIKKAPVKFGEDLLYFSEFYVDCCLSPKSVIITTLTYAQNPVIFFLNLIFNESCVNRRECCLVQTIT